MPDERHCPPGRARPHCLWLTRERNGGAHARQAPTGVASAVRQTWSTRTQRAHLFYAARLSLFIVHWWVRPRVRSVAVVVVVIVIVRRRATFLSFATRRVARGVELGLVVFPDVRTREVLLCGRGRYLRWALRGRLVVIVDVGGDGLEGGYGGHEWGGDVADDAVGEQVGVVFK